MFSMKLPYFEGTIINYFLMLFTSERTSYWTFVRNEFYFKCTWVLKFLVILLMFAAMHMIMMIWSFKKGSVAWGKTLLWSTPVDSLHIWSYIRSISYSFSWFHSSTEEKLKWRDFLSDIILSPCPPTPQFPITASKEQMQLDGNVLSVWPGGGYRLLLMRSFSLWLSRFHVSN